MRKMTDAERAAMAQELYCTTYNMPLFAPSNGRCPNCGKNIYQTYGSSKGITVAHAAKTLISGCPHCGQSFCD